MEKRLDKRIVITGGSGFIGQNLIDKLLESGYKNIVNISRQSSHGRVKNIFGDFGDRELLDKVIEPGDVIFHLACTTIPATSELDKEKDVLENVVGTIRLLEVCVKKKVDNFIFLSSGGTIYGHHGQQKVSEEAHASPLGAHGIMKHSIESYIKLFENKHGLNYQILRAANPYGRRQNLGKPQGAADIFLNKALGNEPIHIWGDGEVVRDYIYINDLVEAVVLALESGLKNNVLNIGTGQGVTLNSLIETIEKLSGKKISKKHFPQRDFDLPYSVLDIKKAEELLGWKPRYDLESGLGEMIKKIFSNSDAARNEN